MLHLSPNVPAANFWSVTLYDALTASGLDNGQLFPSPNSRLAQWTGYNQASAFDTGSTFIKWAW